MKSVTESIYERGKRGTKYLRVRIPESVRPAYPTHCTHVTLSLGTTDLKAAKILARSHRARLDAEFERVRQQIADRQADLYARQLGASDVSNGRAGDDAVAVFHAIANQAPMGRASTVGGDRGSWSSEFQSRLDEHIKRLGVDQVLSCLEAYSALRPTSEPGNQMVLSVLPSVVIGQLPDAQLKVQGPAEARNGPQEPRKPALEASRHIAANQGRSAVGRPELAGLSDHFSTCAGGLLGQPDHAPACPVRREETRKAIEELVALRKRLGASLH